MPYLGDYLGQLLSEITLARMHADLETVRLAELYSAHPILRTMPVPHMRLPDVDLEVPVLIRASEEPRAGESARGGATLGTMRRKFDDVLSRLLVNAGVALSTADRQKLDIALDEQVARHGVPTETAIDVHRVADDLTATAIHMVGPLRRAGALGEPAGAPPLEAELKAAARLEFLKLRTPPPRLMAAVTTAELREAGAPENLTRLRLKVTEQGVEWTTIEVDGVSRDRLVPE